jgi:hypothetical protein
MSSDTTHLTALYKSLFNERARLGAATTPNEIALRQVWVKQIEREIAGEEKFLGQDVDARIRAMSDDELLRELGGTP